MKNEENEEKKFKIREKITWGVMLDVLPQYTNILELVAADKPNNGKIIEIETNMLLHMLEPTPTIDEIKEMSVRDVMEFIKRSQEVITAEIETIKEEKKN